MPGSQASASLAAAAHARVRFTVRDLLPGVPSSHPSPWIKKVAAYVVEVTLDREPQLRHGAQPLRTQTTSLLTVSFGTFCRSPKECGDSRRRDGSVRAIRKPGQYRPGW